MKRSFTHLTFHEALAATSAKVYLSEMTPPHSRGRYIGFLNSLYVIRSCLTMDICLICPYWSNSFYIGQMTASGIMVASGRWQNNNSWRVPLYIQVSPYVFGWFLL